ncbi:winged helix-turn-helix transcriptional regulator [bacterium]|nr:winged helix-turn-helix transcriptional regulator [bacterium]
MSYKYSEESMILKVLGHPVRLRIVEILRGLDSEKCSVNEIQNILDLPQSTISQHLRILKDKGIIGGSKKRVEVCYRVTDERVLKILDVLKK